MVALLGRNGVRVNPGVGGVDLAVNTSHPFPFLPSLLPHPL